MRMPTEEKFAKPHSAKVAMTTAFGDSVRFGDGEVRLTPDVDVIANGGYLEAGKIVLDDIITHRLPLSEVSRGYDIFKKKEDNCVKVVLNPNA